jgi:hypothetical protein
MNPKILCFLINWYFIGMPECYVNIGINENGRKILTSGIFVDNISGIVGFDNFRFSRLHYPVVDLINIIKSPISID